MDMGFINQDQGANERAWIAIDFFNLCLLDFRRARSLQHGLRMLGFSCGYTYIVQVVRGKDATECSKGNFIVSAGYKVVV